MNMNVLEKIFQKTSEIEVKLEGINQSKNDFSCFLYKEVDGSKSSLVNFILEVVRELNKADKTQLIKNESYLEVSHFFKNKNGKNSGFVSHIKLNEAFYQKSEGEQIVYLLGEFEKVFLSDNEVGDKIQLIKEEIQEVFKQINEENFQYNFSGGFDVKTSNNTTYSFFFEDKTVVVLKNEQKVLQLNEIGKLLEGFYSGKFNSIFDCNDNENCKQSFFGWLHKNKNEISIHKNLFNLEGIIYHKLHNVRFNVLNDIEENNLEVEDYMFTLNSFIDFLQEKWEKITFDKRYLIAFIESV